MELPHHRVYRRESFSLDVLRGDLLRLLLLRTHRVQFDHLTIDFFISFCRQFVRKLLLVTAVAFVHGPIGLTSNADLQRLRAAVMFVLLGRSIPEVPRGPRVYGRYLSLIVQAALSPPEAIRFDLTDCVRQAVLANCLSIIPLPVVTEGSIHLANDRIVVVMMIDRRAHLVQVINELGRSVSQFIRQLLVSGGGLQLCLER